uniref:Uncharacterized protein n=1 Tax=Cyanothece sp. (strain PCC 7425 / ATCC 29141) TaxID=395961 RepID=B8HZD6_CYAP4
MRYWVQYHSYEKMGGLPSGPSETVSNCKIVTDKDIVLDTISDTVFLIVGVSENPKQYLLWERFICDDVADDGVPPWKYSATGKGWVLMQRRGREPLLNHEPGFREYLSYTGNFSRGFHEVTDHPFLEVLLRLSERCKPPSKN